MRKTLILMLAGALFLNTCNIKNQKASDPEFPYLEGPYLGQKPPHLIPEVFAPGIVSLNERQENGISFSPDLDAVYFSAEEHGEDSDIYFSKREGKTWIPIAKANFTKGEKDAEMHPFVSLSTNKIYFTAFNSDLTDTKIWYVNCLKDSWSDARKLDSPINDDEAFYPNQSKNGDLYFTNVSNIKMNYAPNINGEFPEVQDVAIEYGVHGFIAPSQDYLVLNARNKEGEERNDHDIFVCFKGIEGTWSKPINLGNAVNSNFSENTPSITPDGKYLFFCRKNESGVADLFWVSTEVVNRLRPDDLN